MRSGEFYTILVVDDFRGIRQLVSSTLRRRTGFQVTEASDGLTAIQKAEELQPDLILLDIGLPDLSGLEVARRIREFNSSAKILFFSQQFSSDVVREALSLGANGYVHKLSADGDLLAAIEAVLNGDQFVSGGLKPGKDMDGLLRHEILFSPDDAVLLSGLAHFIAAALDTGNAAIVWATESHRDALRQRLYGLGIDADAALQRGTYISADVSEPPDPERILVAIKGLSEAALKMGKKRPRVSVCGERAGLFWAEGKTDAALRLEQLLNELAESRDIDILCVYPLPQNPEEAAFKSVCSQHSAVHYRAVQDL